MIFPKESQKVELAMLNFVFPNGIEIKYIQDTPKFNTILTTDIHGNRSYIYVLKIYEKINPHDYEYMNSFKTDFSDSASVDYDYENLKKNDLNFNNIICNRKASYNPILVKNQKEKKEKNIFYVPISICLWSLHNNPKAFKEILMEILNVISKNKIYFNSFSNEIIQNYRLLELINYFIFISGIASPPHYSLMKMNFRFSQVDFYTPSKYELPHCDMNIQILLDTLEISIILKLWSAILTEKQIIFLSYQSYLLYSIIDALLTLIFPFKWIHPCIACINKKNNDFLDAPFPYIIGVLTINIDLNDLKTQFPNHIICNIDTSQIFCKPFNYLPTNEEEKIRRKIQYVKNPHIYFIEELDAISYENTRPKDTCNKRSLAKNIQYIFFRVLRTPLENYKQKYIINESVFDPEKFLCEFESEDYKYFWNKIIQTLAFEYFIFSDQYIDDSNNIIFENICALSEDDLYINNNDVFVYDLNIQNYIGKIIKELNNENKKVKKCFKENFKKLNDHFNKIIDAENSFNENKYRKTNYFYKADNNSDDIECNQNNEVKIKENININDISFSNFNSPYKINHLYNNYKCSNENEKDKKDYINSFNNENEQEMFFLDELEHLKSNTKTIEKHILERDNKTLNEKNNNKSKLILNYFENKNNSDVSDCEEININNNLNIDMLIFQAESEVKSSMKQIQNNNHNNINSNCKKRPNSILHFYGKNGFLSYINYIKTNIKCFGSLFETYFLKEITKFLDIEIKDNPHLSELEKFEFGKYNPLIISRVRGESFSINLNLKYNISNKINNVSNISEELIDEDNISNNNIDVNLKPRNYSGMNISIFLLNGENKDNDLEKYNFIEFKRCDKPQYYSLLISYFNILRYPKNNNCYSRKSVIDLVNTGNNNVISIKKLNAVRQYVLELYCKLCKFNRCEYSFINFYNIINNLDIEITIKYLSFIPEKFRGILNEKLEAKNKDYDTLYKFRKPKSSETLTQKDKKENKLREIESNNNKNNITTKDELISKKSKEMDTQNTPNLNLENVEISNNDIPVDNKNDIGKSLIDNKIKKAREIFQNKIGAKSLNIINKKNNSIMNSPEKKCNIRYSEIYLEKLQNNLNKKIKEKKISKISNDGFLSTEETKIFKFSNTTTSKISNLPKSENPFKFNKKSEEENQIKEFIIDEENNNELDQEEEQETVFKKNDQNILDMSVNFIGSCDALKIVEKMKNKNFNMMKIIVINNYNFYSEELKNSFAKNEIKIINLIIEFSEMLKEIIERFCLNKLSPQLITKDLLKEVSNDLKFIELKNKLGLLQKINIVKPKLDEKIVFWINTYNFLILFTLIYKNEIPSSEYEFKRILSNSFYNIGNYVVSLNIIQEIIIKGNYDKSKEKDSFLDYEGCYLNINTFLKTEDKTHLFALSKPFKFFPKYYIYTMENYKHLFEENIVEYFKENLIYEFLNNNKIKFYIPEQIKEIDNYFIENMIQYKKYINPDLFGKIKSINNIIIEYTKSEWKIQLEINKKNYLNIKN